MAVGEGTESTKSEAIQQGIVRDATETDQE